MSDPIRQRVVVEGDRVYNVWDQPGRGLILDGNRQIHDRRTARKLGEELGQAHFRIPLTDLELLQAKYPELAARDASVQRKAWVRFYNSPESAPYRVRVKNGGATARVFMGGRQ